MSERVQERGGKKKSRKRKKERNSPTTKGRDTRILDGGWGTGKEKAGGHHKKGGFRRERGKNSLTTVGLKKNGKILGRKKLGDLKQKGL